MYYVMDLLHVTTYYEEFFDGYGIAYCMSWIFSGYGLIVYDHIEFEGENLSIYILLYISVCKVLTWHSFGLFYFII